MAGAAVPGTALQRVNCLSLLSSRSPGVDTIRPPKPGGEGASWKNMTFELSPGTEHQRNTRSLVFLTCGNWVSSL